MTEEYRFTGATNNVFQQFEIRSYYVNVISAPPGTDPSLGRFPLLLLYDNAKGNPEGRIHAVVYFHPDRASLGRPDFRNNVIYLHYTAEMFSPLLECLQSGRRLSCYFRQQRTERFGGIQGGPFSIERSRDG